MLTPDQSRLRVQDQEIIRIKADNARLRNKLKAVIDGLTPLIEMEVLPKLSTSKRISLREHIDELKSIKLEDF